MTEAATSAESPRARGWTARAARAAGLARVAVAIGAAGCPVSTEMSIGVAPAPPVAPSAPAPDPDTAPNDTSTTVELGCVGGALTPDGLFLAAQGATLEVGADALPLGTEVTLCPGEPVADPLATSEAWQVRFTPEAPVTPGARLWLDISGKSGAQTALFVPGANGQPQRSLTAVPTYTGWAGPLFRAGTAYLATDPRFVAPYAPEGATVDLLLVIDNSCSMLDEQLKLSNVLPGRLLDVLDGIGADYHVGVITTDNEDPSQQGRLIDVDGVRWVGSDTQDRDGLLASLVYVGNDGSTDEQGLATTVSALNPGNQWNAGFRRDSSELAVVAITDEDDASQVSANDAADALYGYDPMELEPAAPGLPLFHSLVKTSGPTRGTKYIDVSATTGGQVGDLVNSDWDAYFDGVAARFAAVGGMAVTPELAEAPELWLVPADGTEPTPLLASAVGWDPESGRVYPIHPAMDGVLWVIAAE